MATAKRLPSGHWRVQAKSNNIRRSFTAETKAEAMAMAAEWQQGERDSVKCDITLSEAIDRYIESKSKVLSPNTVREYKKEKGRALQSLMPVKIKNITREMVQAAINEEAATHSPKTVRDIHGFLSAVLRMFRPDLILNTKLPQKKPTELHIPEDDDIKKVLAAAKGTDMELAIMLAAFGPMRRGEILALTDEDVHGNEITVNKSLAINEQRETVIKPPKTASSYRTIEFPDFVIELTKGKKGRLVELNPRTFEKHFKIILGQAKVEPFRFHDLRHYNVSILHAMGIPDQYIMARGGWATNATMNAVYRHQMKKAKDETTAKILNHFNNFG